MLAHCLFHHASACCRRAERRAHLACPPLRAYPIHEQTRQLSEDSSFVLEPALYSWRCHFSFPATSTRGLGGASQRRADPPVIPSGASGVEGYRVTAWREPLAASTPPAPMSGLSAASGARPPCHPERSERSERSRRIPRAANAGTRRRPETFGCGRLQSNVRTVFRSPG